jgi:hypothetical protein
VKINSIKAITLSVVLLAGLASVVYQVQYSSAYSWQNCAEKKEGKAPIAISGDNVYVAWWGNSTGNHEVMFKASSDGGQTFGEKINLSNSPNGTSVEADVATSGDNVYVTFADNMTGNPEAYLAISNDNGETFNPLIRLSDGDSNSSATMNQAMSNMTSDDNTKMPNIELQVAAQEDNVYIVATASDTNNATAEQDVFIRVSNDGGQTFGEEINLSQSEGVKSDRMHLEALDDNVYVTWWDKNMNDSKDTPLMRISEDGGQTFGDIIDLSANSTLASSNTLNTTSS